MIEKLAIKTINIWENDAFKENSYHVNLNFSFDSSTKLEEGIFRINDQNFNENYQYINVVKEIIAIIRKSEKLEYNNFDESI
jgi:hypothetical protein